MVFPAAKSMTVVACCVALAVTGCKKSASSSPVASPDGKFVLVASINRSKANMLTYLCVVLDIRDSNGASLQTIQTGASDRLKWKVAWDRNNRIWLDSSDIGVYCWEKSRSGRWQELDFQYGEKKKKKKDRPQPPAGIRRP
jgi:hypothetical protein